MCDVAIVAELLMREFSMDDKIATGVATQAAYTATGAAIGAAAHHAITRHSGSRAPLAVQIGSAMGAAAVRGAGVTGTIAAGTAVVTAKVVAVTALATAAAPIVLGAAVVGAVGWGLFKVFGDSDK
jgi:uncharacterized membrane protein YedE/YeeE